MNPILERFNSDIQTKEAVIEFIHDYINEKALERVYQRKSVSDVADAMELINGAFTQLADDYGIHIKKKEATNEAR